MNATPSEVEPVIILLVEDEPAHAEIVRRNFAGFQMANRPVQLMHVVDGQQALDYLFRQGKFQDPTWSCSTCACPRWTDWKC